MEPHFTPSKEIKILDRNEPLMGKLNYYEIKIIIFLFPIILALIFLAVKVWLPETYIAIVQEDTAIEWFQALFLFVASIVTFIISFKFLKSRLKYHSILYGILAVALLFISLEEISWGQRILNIETTGYFQEKNMQEEITLHNLESVAPLLSKLYILIGLYGACGFLIVAQLKLKRWIPFANFYVPYWFLGSYFFFVFFIYAFLSYIRPFAVNELGIEELQVDYFFIYRDQEPAELLLSMGFLLFVVVNYFRLKKMEQIKGTIPIEYFNVNGKGKTGKSISTKDRSPVSGANRIKEPLPNNSNKGR